MQGDVEVLRADREKCPICGHPTGDCVGDETLQLAKIVGLGAFPSMKLEPTIIVREDVWEERWLSPFTKRNIRVAKAGTGIPLSQAVRLGIVSENSADHDR